MRMVCEALKVSLPYMSDVENDRRNPLDKEKLDQLMGVLCLSREEQQELYDLAGRGRDTVSPDLQEYIMDTDAVRIALRHCTRRRYLRRRMAALCRGDSEKTQTGVMGIWYR